MVRVPFRPMFRGTRSIGLVGVASGGITIRQEAHLRDHRAV
jgi:hypothetical protein